jgi:histidinol-phosphate aminotransferase
MFREAIEKMAAYQPGEQPRPGERLIKLNTNENPYPPSPRVRRAVVRAATDSLRLYPAPRADDFIASASKLYGVREDMILAGNGSDELLAMIFRATLGPGDTVAYPVPTYSLYDTLASIQEARVLRFPVNRDFSIPLDQLAESRANLTIVCSPNSPSGILTPTAKLAKLARALKDRLLVLDEAYVDFAAENAIGLLRRFPNVVILRTLSKSFSLAGMRLGLCFTRPAIVEELMKVKDSYNLSRIALAAGAAALNDAAWMRRNVERVKQTRETGIARLRKMGFEVPESSANFVLARRAGHDLEPMVRAIRKRGILVRYFPTPMLRDSIRISIGTPAEMNALFNAIAANLSTLNVNGASASRRRG